MVVEEGRLTDVQHEDLVKERDLARHLENGPEQKGDEDTSTLAETDFQLYQALNLLKALNIVAASHAGQG